MEVTVDPILVAAIPIVIALIRNFSATVADSPYWSIGLAVVLGALTAGASALGIPIPGVGEATLATGVLSALTGIGGVEVAKLAPKVRAVNKSSTQPRTPKS